MKTIGVLALQGAFSEHEQALEKLGAQWFEIRQSSDFHRPMDGLILPGGESTVMGKLLRESALFGPMKSAIEKGLPVFATCAGLILLAQAIEGGEPPHLATMEATAVRNAYGRQLGSFSTVGNFQGIGPIPMTFIRAPYLSHISENVTGLASIGGHIVAARQGNQLATAFHPELTADLSVHRYFLERVIPA